MTLWFKNADGEERVIKENVNTWEEVRKEITDFITLCNTNKTQSRKQIYGDNYNPIYDNPFVWYYTRAWKQNDGRTCIDVGSHTEFFIWDGDYEGGKD